MPPPLFGGRWDRARGEVFSAAADCYRRLVADDGDEDIWPRAGDRVGPYVVGARIEVDTEEWQRVYHADGDVGRVALGLIHLHDGEDAMARKRFEREVGIVVTALRALNHPAIRRVHASGTHGPLGWLAVAPVEGVRLLEWRASRPWKEVLAVLREVGRALVAVETAGLLGDALRPDDIRVGADGRVHVDVARGMTTGQWTLAALAREEAVVGAGEGLHSTPEFLRAGPRSSRSTQHVFCNIAWQALYRRFPWDMASHYALAIIEGRLAEPPPGTGVPEAIRRTLTRGLAADPAARWPSLEALLAALTPCRGLLARLLGR